MDNTSVNYSRKLLRNILDNSDNFLPDYDLSSIRGSLLNVNIPLIPKEIKHSEVSYLCPKCKRFPIIEFKNEKYINHTCKCGIRKSLTIQDLFNPTKNLVTRFSINDKLTKSNNNTLNEGFKCTANHNSEKVHNFRYFCCTCFKNICGECCHNHLEGKCDLIVLDFSNFDTYKKVELINNEMENESNKKKDIYLIQKLSIIQKMNMLR